MVSLGPPHRDGFFMPPEWAPHSRCWMAWPVRESLWGDRLQAAFEAYAEVARSIAEFEPVTMVAVPQAVADVSLYCGSGIGCLPLAHDDSWMRDIGPTFLADGAGNVAGLEPVFNGWGERYTPYDNDAEVAAEVIRHLGLPHYRADVVFEGGGIHTDGEGTLLTTEAVMLDPKRSGFGDKSEAESVLRDSLGIEKVIWLGEGLQGDDTGGHVDNLACFVRAGVVAALSSRDRRDGNHAVLQDNLARLRAATDAKGRPLKVIEVMQPAPRKGDNGQRLPLSYINFYLANGAVVMPSFEDPMDEPAYQALERLFPKRTIITVPALDIVHGGGGIHCVTKQQPTGVVDG